MTIDEQAHTLSFGPEYFQLGQISAYVQPGATRIDSANFLTYGTDSANRETVSGGLDDVAFLNPDGTKVLVAYNNPPSNSVASNRTAATSPTQSTPER